MSASQKITIAFYFPFNKSLTGGPRTLLSFMEMIDRQKYHPIVITQKPSPLVDELRKLRVEVIIEPLPPLLQPQDKKVLKYGLLKKARSIGQLVTYNRRLKSILRDRNVQIVWARNIKGTLFVGGACRSLGITLIWDIALGNKFRGWMRVLHFAGLNLANLVVTEGASQYRVTFGALLTRLYRNKLRSVAPGIEPRWIRMLEQLIEGHTPSSDDTFTLLSVGTISPRKNQMLLLKAARVLVKEFPWLQIKVVGPPQDEEYYQSLLTYTQQEGLTQHVHYLGWCDDIPALMLDAQALVVCSENEGVPHVVYEAMHTGLPVIATAVGGIPDAVIDNITGFLIYYKDVAALVEKIRYLITHPEHGKRMGEQGREHARAHFTSQAYYQKYDHLLTELVGQ